MDVVVYSLSSEAICREFDPMIFPSSLFIEFFPKWEKVALFFFFFFFPLFFLFHIISYYFILRSISDLYSISLFHIYYLFVFFFFLSIPRF